MSEHSADNDAPHGYGYPVTAWMGDDGLGYFYTCPVCHFYETTGPGPCRRVGCDGTAQFVEVRVISPGEPAPDSWESPWTDEEEADSSDDDWGPDDSEGES